MAQRNTQVQDILKRAQTTLAPLGIDFTIAIKVLIIAVVSGLLAALLDQIVGLPTGALAFSFSWFVAALNGPTYAFFKGKDDLAGVVMAAVAGLVTLFFWFIMLKILVGSNPKIESLSAHNLLVYWFDHYLNILKAMLSGILVGLLSYGWFAGLRRLPAKFIP